MLRAIALSLIMLLSLGALIPLATEYSEAHPKHNHKKKKKKKLKKYSKAWWRWYHKKQKRKKAIAARKRALRIKRILAERREKARKATLLAKKEAISNETVETTVAENSEPKAKESKATDTKTVELKTMSSQPAKVDKKGNPRQKVVAAGQDSEATLPSGENAPRGWKRGSSNDDYRIDDDRGNTIGNASISLVGQSSGEDTVSNKKTLGGVPTSALRRTVIDKMVKEEGWVVNDYQKEVNGRKVYVVVAQSPGPGNRVQSRIFYFTEVNGKIYSLSTNTSADTSEKIAQDSERVINSLLRRPVQADLR